MCAASTVTVSFNGSIGLTGESALPPEEETLLLDNYDSDGERERTPESEEDADQGCLKVMHEGGITDSPFLTFVIFVVHLPPWCSGWHA